MTAAVATTLLVSFTIPSLATVSEANAHTHWRARHKRAKSQRLTSCAHLVAQSKWQLAIPATSVIAGGGITVLLSRVASRSLDSDNNVGAMKHVRDGIADALGIDDRDPRVTWEYAQEKGEPGEYAVRVEIRRRA